MNSIRNNYNKKLFPCGEGKTYFYNSLLRSLLKQGICMFNYNIMNT